MSAKAVYVSHEVCSKCYKEFELSDTAYFQLCLYTLFSHIHSTKSNTSKGKAERSWSETQNEVEIPVEVQTLTGVSSVKQLSVKEWFEGYAVKAVEVSAEVQELK